MQKRKKLISASWKALLAAALASPAAAAFLAMAAVHPALAAAMDQGGGEARRIVVLSDVHYGTKSRDPAELRERMARKRTVAEEICSWKDAYLCVFTGDMVEKHATRAECAMARDFALSIKRPKAFVAGNHEIVCSEIPGPDGDEEPCAVELSGREIPWFQSTLKAPPAPRPSSSATPRLHAA